MGFFISMMYLVCFLNRVYSISNSWKLPVCSAKSSQRATASYFHKYQIFRSSWMLLHTVYISYLLKRYFCFAGMECTGRPFIWHLYFMATHQTTFSALLGSENQAEQRLKKGQRSHVNLWQTNTFSTSSSFSAHKILWSAK